MRESGREVVLRLFCYFLLFCSLFARQLPPIDEIQTNPEFRPEFIKYSAYDAQVRDWLCIVRVDAVVVVVVACELR